MTSAAWQRRHISVVSSDAIKTQDAELMGEKARWERMERAGEGREEVG